MVRWWWWCSSIWLILRFTSVSSTKLMNSEDKTVIFDCTKVINELLLNSSNQVSISLLKTALNDESSNNTIYYKWGDESVDEHFFPDTFLKVVDLLESSSGRKPGVPGKRSGGASERTILLSISVSSKNFQYFERLIHDIHHHHDNTTLKTQTWVELLQLKFDKMKRLYATEKHDNNWLRIIISYAFPSENSCKVFSHQMLNMGMTDDNNADAMQSLLIGSHPDTTAFEYDENLIKCKLAINQPSASSSSSSISALMTLLSIEFVSGFRFPESYGLFSELMSSLVKRNGDFLDGNGIPQYKGPLFRLHLKRASSSQEDSHIERGYATLLARFAARWASETGNAVILEATESIISNVGGAVEDFVPTIKDIVIPSLDSSNNNSCNNNDNLPIISPELASLILTRFNLIYFHLSNDKTILELAGSSNACKIHFRLPENNSLKLLVDIDLGKGDGDKRNLEHAVTLFKQQMNNTSSDLPIQAILFRSSLLSSEEVTQAIADFKGISLGRFGCTVKYSVDLTLDVMRGRDSAFADKLFEHCNLPKPKPHNLVIIYDLERIVSPSWMNMDYFRYTSSVQPRLSVISSGVRILKERFPELSVILKLPEARIRNAKNWAEFHSLFCSEQLENANKVVEAFVTWSHIHKVPVILKPVLSSDTHLGWWDRLGGDSGSWSTTAFVTRNHPKTMMRYLEGAKPCLERLEDPPQSPIPMVAGGGMGCTVHVSEEVAVGPSELQMMLEFALHKFSAVEIVGSSSLEHVIPQLEQALLTSSTNNQSHIIFLQLSMEKKKSGLEMQSLMLKLSKLAKELKSRGSEAKISMQISNWEDYQKADSTSDLSRELEALVQYTSAAGGVPIGVVIGNCSSWSILEEGILQDKTFSHFSFLICTTTWDIKYIISEQTDSHTYFMTMTKLLDQLYAIQTAFHRKFPDKEIYFRPEFSTSSSSDYLRIVWDVNRHAELYHMKYFAVNAFDYPTSTGRGSSAWKQGWWRVEDMANLSNPSNYFERESEHLSLPQWRPPPREIVTKSEQITFSWWIFVPSGVGFIMVLLALALFGVWKRSESRYLTRIEELEFLNGGSNDVDGLIDAASTLNQCLNMKFDENFEIPKTNLKSGEATIIGGGNFGLVYKALVKGVLVAVKIPKVGCNPDLFKATLQEIKIMCHVGCHKNVVRFVGAYIKEIGNGILQIATELCVNGTLLSHLRGLSRSIVGTAPPEGSDESLSELVAPFDLERFCMEIAAGMDFLASKRVIHGDLAARNVLLAEHFTCKIGDFGLSRKLYEYETYVKEGQEPLPWRWMAFETLDKREFSVKSDVWSYGVTAWEIYSLGSVPYYPEVSWTTDFVTSLSSGLRLRKPKYSTDDLYAKLLDCWNLEVGARPTFSELCQHFRTIRHGQYAPVLSQIQDSTF